MDPLLQEYVLRINAHEKGHMPITLIVNGAFISGEVIGIKEYFERIGEHLSQGEAPDKIEEEKENFRQDGLRFQREAEELFKAGDKGESCKYIHLKDVRLSLGLGLSEVLESVWRVRLDSVSGFTFNGIKTQVVEAPSDRTK